MVGPWVFSMPVKALATVPLAHSDDVAVLAALHQVAAQVLREALDRGLAHLALKLADASWREVAQHAAAAIKSLFAVVQQPVHHQGWNAALLGTYAGMSGGRRSHVFLSVIGASGRQADASFGLFLPPSSH